MISSPDKAGFSYRMLLAVLSLCLLLAAPVFADEVAPEPVIDPAGIFAEGVTVLETLEPAIKFDDDARLVYFWNAAYQTWQKFPYPAGLLDINDYQPRSDGTFLLFDEAFFDVPGEPTDEMVWLFDPAQRRFARPKAACGMVRALPGEGAWWFIQRGDDYVLCHTDDAKTIALPDALSEALAELADDALQIRTEMSPDGRWLVYHTPFDWYDVKPYDLYSYDLQSGSNYHLGTTVEIERFDILRWIDGTKLLIDGAVPAGSSFRGYAATADVSRETSLVEIGQTEYTGTQFFDHPARLIWLAQNTIYQYRFDSGTTTELFQLPQQEISIGTSDVILFSEPPAAEAPLSGTLAYIRTDAGFSLLSLIDLKTGELRYSAVVTADWLWLDDHTFQAIQLIKPGSETAGILQVTLDDSGAHATILPEVYRRADTLYGFANNGRYLILRRNQQTPYENGFIFYDLVEQQVRPLIKPLVYRHRTMLEQHFDLYRLEDGLVVNLVENEGSRVVGAWRVRIDDIAESSEWVP